MRLLVAASLILACGIGCVEFALALERDGMTTTDTEFCIGEQLTFRCTFAASSYEWTVTGFLDGSMGNGGITSGQNMTVEEFVISTSGVNAFRMSSLQVTVFQGLVGERTITCREPGTTMGEQSDTITVLDYPPAPTISEVTSTTNPPSFTLTIQPPSARTKCVGGQYQLTISSSDSSEQNVTRIIPVADPPVTISYVVDSSVVPNFNICNNSYSFELALAVNTGTTNQRNGQFNYGERGSFSPNASSGNDVSIFASTSIEECSDVAVLVIDRVRNNDMSDITSMTAFIGEGIVNFTGTTDQYTCTPRIELPSGRQLSLPSFVCSANPSSSMSSSTAPTTTAMTPSSAPNVLPIIIGAVVGAVAVIILVVVIALLAYYICRHYKNKKNGPSRNGEEMPLESKPQDPPSVYQDPNSIVRKPAPDSSTDVYTVPQKKQKKGSKKVEPAPVEEEEKMQGTVYAEVDLKNAKKPPPRSRPAPGPPNTIVPQQQDTGNVVYSTVQMQ